MINNIRKKATAIALAGALATASLTGCSNPNRTTSNEEDKPFVAVLFGEENNATIMEIQNAWNYNASVLISLNDGSEITGSYNNTRIIKGMTYEEIEELIVNLMGEDVNITYFKTDVNQKKRKK